MLVKSLLTVVALFVIACSSGAKQPPQRAGGSAGATGQAAGDAGETGGGAGETASDVIVVPEGIDVSARPGVNSVFNVIALTLSKGSSGTVLYAAVRNDGNIPACNPSFSVELRDKDAQSLAAGISGLMVQHFYRLTDGSGSIAGCAAPGDVTMVAITDLSLDGPIEDVRQVVYSSSYWVLNAVAIDGLGVTEVQTVTRSTGVAYTGTLVNGLDVALRNPSVAIFPIDAVGRPLGVAFDNGSVDVPPGGSWDFETSTVSDAGVDYAAFPAGGP